MNFKPVFFVNGILLLVLAGAMLLPAASDLADGNADAQYFLGAALVTAFAGAALMLMNREKKFRMTAKETFLMTAVSWIVIAGFAALPFCFAGTGLSFTDAFFEALSGITATGSTVLKGLDALPGGILLWRSLLHWLGGIGFLIVALAVFPLLQISGMQIFRAQSFEIARVMPSARQMSVYIGVIYAALTVLCALLLRFAANLSPLDALCHAMGAISTGGFSTHDDFVAHFKSPLAESILMVFMILGGLPFVLYLRVAKGDARALFRDSQVRAFLGVIAVFTLLCVLFLTLTGRLGFAAALRQALFMVVSLATTTGFSGSDWGSFGPFASGLAFLAVLLGCCSGSAGGGLKIFRLQILWHMVQQQCRKLMVPNGLFQVRYQGRVIDNGLQAAVGGFLFVYIAGWLLTSLLLQLAGMDTLSAFTAALSALSNTAARASFAGQDGAVIWILSGAMLLGRIEFMTLIVLLMPRFWRD